MKTIALLTDFGLTDNFVGVMKGVILKINPCPVRKSLISNGAWVRMVDITHEVLRHDITQAAFLLKSSYEYFPKGTIFLVVVDPGVGSRRRAIIIRSKDYFFVGPDNGVLSLAAKADGIKEIVTIENKSYFLKPISDTFQGRDIFAPTAAYLAQGKRLKSFGRALKTIKQLNIASPKISKNILKGEVIYIDRFGNLVTNINPALFRRFTRNERFKIGIKGATINSIGSSYQAVSPGKPLAIFGSFNFLEISVNKGMAKKYFRAKKGLAINVLLV